MEAGEFLAFYFFGSHPANSVADISKDAGHVKPYCPAQKIFAPLRLCAFALKITPAGHELKMPFLTELENLFLAGATDISRLRCCK
jgi:hypothetical protein